MPTPDEWAEADLAAEEANGAPLPCTPEKGIEMMERRIEYLDRRIASNPDGENFDDIRLRGDALQRLSEYSVSCRQKQPHPASRCQPMPCYRGACLSM